MDKGFSSNCQNIYDDAFVTWALEGLEQGLAKLDQAFKNKEIEKCTIQEQEFLYELRLVWSRAIDKDYKPPQLHLPSEVQPFVLKSLITAKKGNAIGALYNAWLAVQFQPTGTERLSQTLVSVIEVSVILKEFRVARAAAEMFISNITFMSAMSIYVHQVDMMHSSILNEESLTNPQICKQNNCGVCCLSVSIRLR